jgi:hypothetical protein
MPRRTAGSGPTFARTAPSSVVLMACAISCSRHHAGVGPANGGTIDWRWQLSPSLAATTAPRRVDGAGPFSLTVDRFKYTGTDDELIRLQVWPSMQRIVRLSDG